jgi:hypothetical protein
MEWRSNLHALHRSYFLAYAIQPSSASVFDTHFHATEGNLCIAGEEALFVVVVSGVEHRYKCISDVETIVGFMARCEDDVLNVVTCDLVFDGDNIAGVRLGFDGEVSIMVAGCK